MPQRDSLPCIRRNGFMRVVHVELACEVVLGGYGLVVVLVSVDGGWLRHGDCGKKDV